MILSTITLHFTFENEVIIDTDHLFWCKIPQRNASYKLKSYKKKGIVAATKTAEGEDIGLYLHKNETSTEPKQIIKKIVKLSIFINSGILK